MFETWPPAEPPSSDRPSAGPPPPRRAARHEDTIDDTPFAPPRDLIALVLMFGAALFFFLIVPALLLIWISRSWRIGEKLAVTVVPLALAGAARTLTDSSGDVGRMFGMLAIASCIGAAFFLAARIAGRRS